MGVCWGGNPQRRNGWPRTREQAGIHHSLGAPDELVGTAIWLASERASGFVTGTLVPVDGGFAAMTI